MIRVAIETLYAYLVVAWVVIAPWASAALTGLTIWGTCALCRIATL